MLAPQTQPFSLSLGALWRLVDYAVPLGAGPERGVLAHYRPRPHQRSDGCPFCSFSIVQLNLLPIPSGIAGDS